MKQPKLKGPWVDWKVAMKWKEGSVVLIWRTDRSVTSYNALTIQAWFRPDWINSANGYGTAPMKFKKLSI